MRTAADSVLQAFLTEPPFTTPTIFATHDKVRHILGPLLFLIFLRFLLWLVIIILAPGLNAKVSRGAVLLAQPLRHVVRLIQTDQSPLARVLLHVLEAHLPHLNGI